MNKLFGHLIFITFGIGITLLNSILFTYYKKKHHIILSERDQDIVNLSKAYIGCLTITFLMITGLLNY